MSNKGTPGLLVAVALLNCTAAVSQGLPDEREIRFRLFHDSLIVVSVVADRQGPFNFVLDTGSDLTVVDPALADRLSLPTLRQTTQSTLAGTQTLRVALMTSLSAGPAHLDHLPVMVQDLSGVRRMVPEVQGIVGQDFLSHFNYLLDYRKRSLLIEQDTEVRTAIEGNSLQIETGGNRMIALTEAPAAGLPRLRLILDSGASSVVLMRKASEAFRHSAQEVRTAITSSGPVSMRMGSLGFLVVGSQVFRDVAVALTAIDGDGEVGDGLLPTAMFQTLYVNNREAFVIFNPRRKRN